MTKALPLLALLAVGAGAAVTRSIVIRIATDGGYAFEVAERDGEVRLSMPSHGNYLLPREEAALLGRALLEAAGERPKECAFDALKGGSK